MKIWLEGNPIAFEKHYRPRIFAYFPHWAQLALDCEEHNPIEAVLVEHYIATSGCAPPGTTSLQETTSASSAKNLLPTGTEEIDAKPIVPRDRLASSGTRLALPMRSAPVSLHRSQEGAVEHLKEGPAEEAKVDCATPTTRSGVLDMSIASLERDDSTTAMPATAIALSSPVHYSPKHRRAHRAKSVEIGPPPDNPDGGSPLIRRKKKKKKEKEKKRDKSSVLEAQERDQAHVAAIFEAGGENALAVYQAWVDEMALCSTPHAVQVVKSAQSPEAATRSSSPEDCGDNSPPRSGHVDFGAPVTSTPKRQLVADGAVGEPIPYGDSRTSNTSAAGKNGDATSFGGDSSTAKSSREEEFDLIDGAGCADVPLKSSKDIAATEAAALDREQEERTKTVLETSEFIVDVFDRTNQTSSRMLQVQGTSSIAVIDYTTGRTIDMYDLAVLVDAKRTSHQGRDSACLKFVYGRKDRRTLEFMLADSDECDNLLALLTPIVSGHNTETLNASMSVKLKCLGCDHVFGFEDHRFDDDTNKCPTCRSSHVVEFFVNMLSGGDEPTSSSPPRSEGSALDPAEPGRGWKHAAAKMSAVAGFNPTGFGGKDDPPLEAEADKSNVAECPIPDTVPFDCRIVDHNRKLVLDLQYFDDGERCIAAIDGHVLRHKRSAMDPDIVRPIPSVVALSTSAMHFFSCGADPAANELKLLGRHPWQQFRRVIAGTGRQYFRMSLATVDYDVFVGAEDRVASFLAALGETPALAGIPFAPTLHGALLHTAAPVFT